MTGTDDHGNYTIGKIVQISGDSVTYTLSTYPTEYPATVPNPAQFHPQQLVKVYQNGMVLPL